MKVVIYSDGGADPNPGVGGWAAILRAGGREKVLKGNEPWTTNNRMELRAAISALQALKRPSEVEFHTDSEYVRKGITEWIEQWKANDWQRKGEPVANADLWRELWSLVQLHDVQWHWVKGHSGDRFNERVDAIARQARLEISPEAGDLVDVPRLYLRGTCRGNPGPGGWGVILEEGEETTQLSGSEHNTTNNRMELTAAIEGLRQLLTGNSVAVFTTSDYVFQGATRWINGWRRRDWKKRDGKPISNKDLWQQLDTLMMEYDVRWVNAKGEKGRQKPGLLEAAALAASAVEFA